MSSRPKARTPRASLDEPPAPLVEATPDTAAPLRPAPDNGRPYGAPELVVASELASGGRPAASARRGRQLGHRVPEELVRRLQECSEATGITQQRLIIRALDAELTRHGH